MEFGKIVEIITEIKDLSDASGITSDTDLIEDLSFDSIDIVLLVCNLEKSFDIVITDEELDIDMLKKVGNIVNIISAKISERV